MQTRLNNETPRAQDAVEAAKASLLDDTTVLGVTGTSQPGFRTYWRPEASNYLPPGGMDADYTEQTYASGVPRTERRLLMAAPSGEAAFGTQTVVGWGEAKTLTLMAQIRGTTQSYLWAAAVDGDDVHVCRFDGTTWAQLGTFEHGGATAIDWGWSLSGTDALISFKVDSIVTLWRVSWDGATLTAAQATLDGSAFALPADHIIANHDCLAMFPATGTLVLGTYAGGAADTSICRLANGTGGTWTSEEFPMEISGSAHFHALCYHAGTERMIAVRGDSLWYWEAADDGASGTKVRFAYPATGIGHVTGVCCDVGHATELVQGSHDAASLMIARDVSGSLGAWRELGTAFLTLNGPNQCLSVAKVGDYTIFTSTFQSVPPFNEVTHCGIYATTDFTDVVEIHQYPTGPYAGSYVRRASYIGTLGGNMYFFCLAYGADFFSVVPIPTLVDRTAKLVQGPVTNLDTSTQESLGAWKGWSTNAGYVNELTTDYARRGTTSMRFKQPTGSKYIRVVSNGSNSALGTPWAVTAGKQYQVNLSTLWQPVAGTYIENTQGVSVRIELWNTDDSAWDYYGGDPYPRAVLWRNSGTLSPYWQDHRITVRVPNNIPSYVYTAMRVVIETTAAASDGDVSICVGAVEVVESNSPPWPGSIADSAGPSEADSAYGLMKTGDQFTSIMGIQPNFMADYAGDAVLPIRSWAIDAANYLTLSWVPQTQIYTGTVTGISTVTITAAGDTFPEDVVGCQFIFDTSQQIYTVVSRTDATHVVLSGSAAAESDSDTYTIKSTQGQFQIGRSVTGPTVTIQCATADLFFGKSAMVWLVTQVDGTNARLSVCVAGQAWEHVSAGDSAAEYADAELTTRLGSVTGANVPSMAILEDRLLDTAFDDDAAGKAAIEAYVASLAG